MRRNRRRLVKVMTKEERDNARIDVERFNKMSEECSKIVWDGIAGVEAMKAMGWEFYFHKGEIDETPHYIRREEDVLMFKNEKYQININTSSAGLVIMDIHNSQNCYTHPTIFLSIEEISALYAIQKLLESIVDGELGDF